MKFDFIEDEALRKQAEESFAAEKEGWDTDVQKKIDDAIAGLQTKNDELLNEKKQLQKKFEGITDPAEALEALRLIQENEDIQLIQQGKLDEVIAKRTSAMKQEHDATVTDLTEKLSNALESSTTYKARYETKMVEDDLRAVAIKAGVRAEALPDVLRRGLDVFSLGEKGEVESRDDKGNLRKIEGIVVTPANWVEGLKESSPHYWPGSDGAGARGGGSAASDDAAKLIEYAESGNMKAFTALRNKMAAQ